MAAKSRTAAPRRGRPSKKKTAQTELNRSWSILLFGLAGVLFALTYIRGAAAWNAVAGWLFGLFGVITYAVAPVTAFLAVLIAMDTMEELHVIGPYEGSKPRAVLIGRQQFIEMFTNSDDAAQ